MDVIYGSRENFNFPRPVGIGIGVFDGIHIGHGNLIHTLIDNCRKQQMDSVIFTFTRHPESVLRKGSAPRLLTTEEQKIRILKQMGVDYLYLEEFDDNFARLEPEDFVTENLLKGLNARLIVVGYNFRFGYKGRGDVNLLRKMGRELGFQVIVAEPVKIQDYVVSSSYIRELIANGDVGRAAQFLGRPFAIAGMVVHGRQVGHRLGFPTANIAVNPEQITPARGVYITRTLYKDTFYNGLTNVGVNPTVSGKSDSADESLSNISVENHLLDINKELYGEKLEIQFIRRVRPEFKFSSVEELACQIQRDVQTAREYFMNNSEYKNN